MHTPTGFITNYCNSDIQKLYMQTVLNSKETLILAVRHRNQHPYLVLELKLLRSVVLNQTIDSK